MGAVCKVIILVSRIMIVQSFALTSDRNNSAEGDINGEYLMKMGSLINKPVLSLIGAAIHNLHLCEQWTDWSTCTASRPNHFGIEKRTRQCSIKKHMTQSKTTRIEEELNVCKGACPVEYEFSKSGFCLKLYTSNKSQTDAKKQCESDGGNLVKVDAESKYDDIGKLNGMPASRNIYVDGVRKDTKSAWMFDTESKSIFFKWAKNEPDNGSGQFCLIMRGSDQLMFDATCTTHRHFICEIDMKIIVVEKTS